MPVRWTIHSAVVAMQRGRRWLSTTQGGTAMPVPTMRFTSAPAESRRALVEERGDPFRVVLGGDRQPLGERLCLERRGEVARGRAVQQLLVEAQRERRAPRGLVRPRPRRRPPPRPRPRARPEARPRPPRGGAGAAAQG